MAQRQEALGPQAFTMAERAVVLATARRRKKDPKEGEGEEQQEGRRVKKGREGQKDGGRLGEKEEGSE